MGDYTGIHLRFTLKKETPPVLLDYFKKQFGAIPDDSNDVLPIPRTFQSYRNLRADADELENAHVSEGMSSMIFGSSAYFDNWNTQSFRTNEDGSFSCESFASTKDDDVGMLCMFFDVMQSNMVLEHGQIVARTIYEIGRQENVVFWHESTKRFMITVGYDYNPPKEPGVDSCSVGEWYGSSEPWSVYSCWNHPSSEDKGDERFVPSMNIFELYPEYKDALVLTNPFAESVGPYGARLDAYRSGFYFGDRERNMTIPRDRRIKDPQVLEQALQAMHTGSAENLREMALEKGLDPDSFTAQDVAEFTETLSAEDKKMMDMLVAARRMGKSLVTHSLFERTVKPVDHIHNVLQRLQSKGLLTKTNPKK